MTPSATPAEAKALLARPGLARIFDLLDRDGEEARVAGGAVRDLLIGRPVREIDIATTALPQEVVRRAKAAGIKTVPTGIAHGTVTLVVEGEPYEVTTLRRDVATDGRHAEVAFGRDWAADAARRDFTINGLFVDRAGVVHDHVGGLDDIARRRLAFIGDPDTRIREDYLRILRFFRFFAVLGEGEADPAALAAAARARAGLSRLSRERVGQEFLKLLSGARAHEAARLMAGRDLLMPVIGGVPSVALFGRVCAIEDGLRLAPDAVLRLGALAVLKREDAERLGAALRLPKRDAARLARLSAYARVAAPGERALREMLYREGAAAYRDRMLLAWARAGETDDAGWRDRLSLPDRWSPPALPFSGRDFAGRGIDAGPRLGRALRWAEAEWIRRGFPEDRAALEDIEVEAVRRA